MLTTLALVAGLACLMLALATAQRSALREHGGTSRDLALARMWALLPPVALVFGSLTVGRWGGLVLAALVIVMRSVYQRRHPAYEALAAQRRRDSAEFVALRVASLPRLERDVWLLRNGDAKADFDEVARRLGVSKRQARRAYADAMGHLSVPWWFLRKET